VRFAFANRVKWLGPLAGVAALSVGLGLGAVALGAGSGGSTTTAATQTTAPTAHGVAATDGLGIRPGKIKHVWLIILENKSYDATFTGLNNNTYLWKDLPHQGALLTQYYGTGHYSLDNYISAVSGQATQPDTQDDCPYYTAFSSKVDTSGSLKTNPNYGQAVSNAGPNAAPGANGCVYPASVPTLFNQLDAAGVSWKGYAQDLNTTTTPVTDPSGPTHSQGEAYCGAPYKSAAATGTTTQPNPGSANASDQYVPKHFPFPWFQSISAAGDCNAKHIANLFDANNGLYHDLQSVKTTPAFSWISPNNCSDAHDAVCHGNNLSGGFKDPTTPNAPVNYTGGLYASDLFLEHVIPEIEASPAFKQGGLIDVTFDEGFPPFTYTGNSFSNATNVSPNALTSINSDSAAQTINGKRVNSEPTGPNTPLATDANGYQLDPGPGYNAFIDRPADCVAQTVPAKPSGTCLLGGGSAIQGASTESASAASGATEITDLSAVATDVGRSVTGTGIPAGAFVGQVFNNPNTPTSPNGAGGNDLATTGAFTIVDQNGAPLKTTAAVTSVVLGARTAQTDPLYDAYNATTGGGDTGSVLISPYIDPGTVSDVAYNHYSWLRTMEDLFVVGKKSPGLDGKGHIGYAAQSGLAPFGPDIFTRPNGPWGSHGH
jgi:hypothetical protein